MATSSAVPPNRSMEVARLELSRFAPDAPLNQVFAHACELSANTLGIERVGVWLFIDNQTALRCANLFERSRREHSAGTVLRVADFPIYFTSLKIRKAIPAEIAPTAPWTAELAATYLQPLGISSMLDAGIFVDGTLVGVVCHENVGLPREWTTEERDFAGSVADLLALRIQSAEVRELRSAFLTQQERLAAQDKAAALAQLAAGMAHDFRNLLTVFLGCGQLLSIHPNVPPDAREQARAITEAAERGIALVEELVEFARPGERHPAVLDLAVVTADFLPVLQAAVGSRYEVRHSHPHTLGQVLIDRAQFTRLLMNLVLNASEAMPAGGHIDLRLTNVKVTDHPSYSGRSVLVEVADAGVGMDEATQRRIFEPFFTTKDKGTGLGLAVVRQIVDQAGGMIRVASVPGRGTTVRVFFPCVGMSNGEASIFPLSPELERGEVP